MTKDLDEQQTSLLGGLESIGDNKANLRRLVQQIGTPQGVVPFVGAGMSIQYGMSGWSNFLISRAEAAGNKRKVQRRLRAGEYEEAAEDLQALLGLRGFPDAIEDEYGPHKLDGVRVSGAASLLPQLTTGPVITTNFDHVLELAFEQAGRPFRYVVWGAKPDIINEALQHQQNILIKVHGDVKDRTDRILTRNEYDQSYGSRADSIDFSLPLPRILRQVLVGRALLFVGCSLNQDRTIRIMQQIAAEAPETAHYAIVEKPATEAEFRKRKLYLSDRNIRPIWYPTGKHDTVEILLAYLVQHTPHRGGNEGGKRNTNLPHQLNRFVGRETEMQEIRNLLVNTRLLTLAGPTGFGKTRIANQVGADVLADYQDGVWLVELSGVENPEQVPQTVASILGIPEEAGRTTIECLFAYFKPKSSLLLLDNCEKLAPACAELVEALLKSCPGLKVLATSQQTIGSEAERMYPLPPLSLPDVQEDTTSQNFLQYDAVRLFVERASAVSPCFVLTEQNKNVVLGICKRLDGNPLAIELAAARVNVLAVEQILVMLDKPFELLTSSRRTSTPRHQSLLAALEWSFSLCSDVEKAFLRRMSVYVGGWTVEMASRTIIGSNLNVSSVLDVLSGLVGKSLIVNTQQDGHRRYRMLGIIQQFCHDQLAESGETDAASSHHADAFLELAVVAHSHIVGPEQTQWLGRLDGEHDNLIAALTWMSSKDNLSTLIVKMSGALSEYWHVRGYYTEGREWLRRALAQCDQNCDPDLRLHALNGAGNLAFIHGDAVEARALFEQEIELAEAVGNKTGVALGHSNLSPILYQQGDAEAGWRSLQQSLAIYKELGDRRSIAVSQINMARIAMTAKDFASATALVEDSLGKFRELGDEGSVATCLLDMAELARDQGQFAVAEPLLEESLALNRRIGNKKRIADVLHSKAILEYHRANYESAQELFEQVRKIAEELGNKHKIALALWSLGKIAHHQKKPAIARAYLGQSQALYEELGEIKGIAECLYMLGNVSGSEGNHEQAAYDFGNALLMQNSLSDVEETAKALHGLARVAMMQGKIGRMATLFGAAETMFQSIGSPPTIDGIDHREMIADVLASVVGPNNFHKVWEEGKRMSSAEAVAFAVVGIWEVLDRA